ncbi:hypothetical protein V8E54_000399 [Elaphomyces granulatus]
MVQAIAPAGSLSNFPFMTSPEFCDAAEALCRRVHAVGGPHKLDWWSVRLQQESGRPILKISKNIASLGSSIPRGNHLPPEQDEPLEDRLKDDDTEALVRTSNPDPLRVEYDIILSPTYRVPVLYFLLRNIPSEGPTGIDAVYQYLVPHHYRSPLGSVGIMGGYHPESGIPMYFVHPCDTANAMRGIVGQETIGTETYLFIWLGLVGNCVNLHLPSRLLADSDMG